MYTWVQSHFEVFFMDNQHVIRLMENQINSNRFPSAKLPLSVVKEGGCWGGQRKCTAGGGNADSSGVAAEVALRAALTGIRTQLFLSLPTPARRRGPPSPTQHLVASLLPW